MGACLLKAGVEYAIYYLVEPNPTTMVVNDCLEAAKLCKWIFWWLWAEALP